MEEHSDLMTALLDAINDHQPTLEETHCTLAFILADVVCQMADTPEEMQQYRLATNVVIEHAMAVHNAQSDATLTH